MVRDKTQEQLKSEELEKEKIPQKQPKTSDTAEQSAETQKEEIEMVEIPKAEYETLLKAKKIADEEVKRARADSLNFRKRVEKEKAEFIEYAASSILSKLLVVSDDLQRLIETSKNHIPKDHFEGIKNINLRINSIFEGEGVDLIKIKKKKTAFDPKHHEAVVAVPTDEIKPNVIIDIISNGFVKNDRVLRPARVVISKEIPKEEPPKEESSKEEPTKNTESIKEIPKEEPPKEKSSKEKSTKDSENEKAVSSEDTAKTQ